jgi:hypothetical protein
MEKKETRIKCSSCGTSYKVKVPVTDKPVSFKCKKCGKVLKIRLKGTSEPQAAAVPPPPPLDPAEEDRLETSQLPEFQTYQETVRVPTLAGPSVVEHLFPESFEDRPGMSADRVRRWLVLADDVIKGPFSDQEIAQMIEAGEVTEETQLRMGERPWVKVSDIQNFKGFFGPGASRSMAGPGVDAHLGRVDAEPHFYEQLPGVFAYPVAHAKHPALPIFLGIAFLLSTILAFDLLIGLPLNILGWILLYGYLVGLMQAGMESPENPPPGWDFSRVTSLLAVGAKVFVVLLVYSLLPAAICLLLMIAFVLNKMPLPGYIMLALTVLIYMASLFVVPASLVILGASRRLGAALNPGKAFAIVKKGGRAYSKLAMVSTALGLACMVAVGAGVFLADIPLAGFVVSGLVMALVLSYCHVVWFHVMGRFSKENKALTNQIVSVTAS